MTDSIPNRGPELRGVNIFFLCTVLISTALRCYVRIIMVRAFGIDDWLMLAATFFFCLYASFSTAGTVFGTGRHRSDVTVENYSMGMMCWWNCYLWYASTMMCAKVSIGWFLLRIITKRLHMWIIYCAMAITVVSGLVFFFVTIFQCHPVSYFWNQQQDGSCINSDVVVALAFLYTSTGCISDFVFALLPAFLVYNLNMKSKTKIFLIPLLAVGCVASAAVVARYPYLPKIADPDFLWATVDVAIWSTVEQGLCITAASLATIRPLAKLVGYRLGLTTKPSNLRGSSYGMMGASNYGRSRKGSLGPNEAYKLSAFQSQNDSTWSNQEKGQANIQTTISAGGNVPKGKACYVSQMISHTNTSEEALAPQSSKDAVKDPRRVEPKSFLAADDQT